MLSPYNGDFVHGKLKSWIHEHYAKNVVICVAGKDMRSFVKGGRLENKAYSYCDISSIHNLTEYQTIKWRSERIITYEMNADCVGSTRSVVELCICVIEKFGSRELASLCTKRLIDGPRNIYLSEKKPSSKKDHHDFTVKKAQHYMEHKYNESITVEELASYFGISQRHFVRRFRKATGVSPQKYLQRIRIEAAKEKLAHTGQSISKITKDVGYEDPNSIRRLFKKSTGQSPRQYRNQFLL